MDRTIRRSIVSGKIRAPPSAAMAHRAVVAASLSPEGHSVLSRLPLLSGVEATIAACRAFGADIVSEGDVLDVFGARSPVAPSRFDCNESNTTLKLMLPIASLFESEVGFVGRGRLASKKLEPFTAYLSRLGAYAEASESGKLPLRLKGPLEEGQLVYFPKLGTQFLSGLLLCAPLRGLDTEIGIEGRFASPEYISATVELMRKCGIQIEQPSGDYLLVAGEQEFSPLPDFEIPGSAYLASFLLLAGAIAGKVKAEGMPRPDALEGILLKFGAAARQEGGLFVASAGTIGGAELDALSLGPYLPHAIVLAGLSLEETRISNVLLLPARQKQRMRLLVRELSKMGLKSQEEGGGLLLSGGKLSAADIRPEGDAVVAMCCSAAALAASGASRILGAECVEKSYPGFFKDLASLGAIIR